MKIYLYETDEDLPFETVFLQEDRPLSSLEYRKRWCIEHGIEDETRDDKDFEPYERFLGDESSYTRVKFNRPYKLFYYEVLSLEEFLVGHPERPVIYYRDHFFVKDWLD